MTRSLITLNPYDHYWRTVERPAALDRFNYRCMRCHLTDWPRPWLKGQKSRLDCCHLDGNPYNRNPENHGIMCRECHRRTDYKSWIARWRTWWAADKQRQIDERDAARPILEFLRRGRAAQNAVDSILLSLDLPYSDVV